MTDPRGFVFHITPARNLPSIAEHGLVPQVGPRSASANEQEACAFCFTSLEAVEDALANWLGDEFDDDEQLALLAVSHAPEDLEFFECEIRSVLEPARLWLITDDVEGVFSLEGCTDWSPLAEQSPSPAL